MKAMKGNKVKEGNEVYEGSEGNKGKETPSELQCLRHWFPSVYKAKHIIEMKFRIPQLSIHFSY
jgi:hypothetical protein